MNRMGTNVQSNNSLLNTIHKVDGFDPAAYAVEYTDLYTGEVRKRLPVMAQMAWFRLVYPEGKISVSVTSGKDCFVATARVYPSYKDPAECYLAEATASRGPDPTKPSVSAREWAQTAAVGIALRNAGFGLQFSAAGDESAANAPNELDVPVNDEPVQQGMETPSGGCTQEERMTTPPREPSPEEHFQQCASMIWPTKKHAGRTLGEVLQMEPSAIEWLANRYTGKPEVSAAAKFMCEYAMNHAGA